MELCKKSSSKPCDRAEKTLCIVFVIRPTTARHCSRQTGKLEVQIFQHTPARNRFGALSLKTKEVCLQKDEAPFSTSSFARRPQKDGKREPARWKTWGNEEKFAEGLWGRERTFPPLFFGGPTWWVAEQDQQPTRSLTSAVCKKVPSDCKLAYTLIRSNNYCVILKILLTVAQT